MTKKIESKPYLDYQKYRWFFTSSGKLVIGGKSAIQNDELLKDLKKLKGDYIVMHTATPGSPFSVIIASKKDIKPSDLEETAIFTGCFSRAWRSGKKQETIDIFQLSQLSKPRGYPTGRWNVKGKVKKKTISLELVLTKQENKLRAVPEKSAKKNILLRIKPGRIDKKEMLPKLQVEISESLSQEEMLSALPPGGIAISRR